MLKRQGKNAGLFARSGAYARGGLVVANGAAGGNYPGRTGGAVVKMPGESASAAYVRHSRLYLNFVMWHNYACLW